MQQTKLLTNSMAACFKSCRQKCYWSYEMGWRPDVEKTPLRIGSMVHEGLDLHAKDVPTEQILEVIRNAYAEKIADDMTYNPYTKYKLQIECETVLCLLAGYFKAWADSQIEIIESETNFNLPIINPDGNAMTSMRQAGKRDRIGRLPDGRIALMETKTAGEDIGPDSDFRNILAINQQISMYINAAQAEGKQIETALYDCIRKPSIRPSAVPLTDDEGVIVLDAENKRVYKTTGDKGPRKTGDKTKGYTLQSRDMTPDEWCDKLKTDIEMRPEFYYQRFEVPRLQDDLDAFNTELWMIAKDISDCRRMGRWYRNTSNCRMYNSMCPYYVLCAGERDTSNGCPEGFRQAETAHEELALGITTD